MFQDGTDLAEGKKSRLWKPNENILTASYTPKTTSSSYFNKLTSTIPGADTDCFRNWCTDFGLTNLDEPKFNLITTSKCNSSFLIITGLEYEHNNEIMKKQQNNYNVQIVWVS